MPHTDIEVSYGRYSASALDGLAILRNVTGAGFRLLGNHMFGHLGHQWARRLLGLSAIVLVPIPVALERYGVSMRERIPWARKHMHSGSGNEEKGEKQVFFRDARVETHENEGEAGATPGTRTIHIS